MSDEWFQDWVARAEEDYAIASSLDPDRTPRGICFHCQQCVEKYLKAALVRHGIPTRKTHNLILLNDLLTERDPRFGQFAEHLRVLNPYSVATRYPGPDISPEDARHARKTMEHLRAEIRRLLESAAD
jgi:HEPN domain-containing protein